MRTASVTKRRTAKSKAGYIHPTRVRNAAAKLLKLFGPRGTHWMKHKMDNAKFKDGKEAKPATKWCLVGAIDHLNIGNAIEHQMQLLTPSPHFGIVNFNDARSTNWPKVKAWLTGLTK